MFNGKFKLIGTVIGLVAVLVMGLAVPGVTQENLLSRQSLVKVLHQLFATLTASEGDIFDPDLATFYSDAGVTLGIVPMHYKSRSLTLIDDLIAGKAANVTLEAVYVPQDLLNEKKQPFLKQGVYILKAIDAKTAVLVDREGREVFKMPLRLEKLDKPVLVPFTTITVEGIRVVPQQQLGSNNASGNGAPQFTTDQIVIVGTCCRIVRGRSCFLWWCWTWEAEVCETCIIVIDPGQLALGALPAKNCAGLPSAVGHQAEERKSRRTLAYLF